MQAMIGKRVSRLVFLSVPLVALWALSPVWSASQAGGQLLSAVSADDLLGEAADSEVVASAEPVTELSDWDYTAMPMSPGANGKGSYHRRLFHPGPGDHPTPPGPNPRVPWLMRDGSLGNSPSHFALIEPSGNSSTGSANPTITAGNLQNFATPNTKLTPVVVATPQSLATAQNTALMQNVAASQNASSYSFQPVKPNSPGSATRKLGVGNASGR